MEYYEKLNSLGIVLKSNSRQQKTKCPNCKKIGKENYKDLCLSVNLNEMLYNCHKCGWKGFFGKEGSESIVKQNKYDLPKKNNLKKLTKKAIDYFAKRKISESVLNKNKIISTINDDGVLFPYIENGVFTNSKTRFLSKKGFLQSSNAKPIMFNYDRIKKSKEIIICEGEIDAISWEMCGIEYHTSVNQGAPNENDKNVNKKLECITNSYDAFDDAETVYLSVDNDSNGRRLEKELIRRIGAEKCKIIDLKPFKDVNEVLVSEGKESLLNRLKNASDVRVDGIFEVNDAWSSMKDSFFNGKRRGTTTYFPEIDQAYTHRYGEVNVWTGYENEGKSTFLNQLLLIKACFDGDKTAFFSPENVPLDDFFDDFIEMYIGKSCDKYYHNNLMSFEEYEKGKNFMQDHFFMIYPKENFSLDTIFEKARYLVKKKGIRHLVIDPYNNVEHLQKGGEREELYISRFMASLKRFAIDNEISIHLVAHQNSAKVDNNTGLFYTPYSSNIKGGAVFAQKADNVLFIQRPELKKDRTNTSVVFGSLKIKKQKLVGMTQNITDIEFLRKQNRYLVNGFNPLSKLEFKKQSDDFEKQKELPKVDPKEAFGDYDDDKLNEIPF